MSIGQNTRVNTPLVANGKGEVVIGRNCSLGYPKAPRSGLGKNLVQARYEHSTIKVGDDVEFSNNIAIVSLNAVSIGSYCLLGNDVLIFDSDFHDLNPGFRLDPRRRQSSDGKIGHVNIGQNVWICARSVILRDTNIGNGSVVAAGSVVSGKYPDNSLISGVPAKVTRLLA